MLKEHLQALKDKANELPPVKTRVIGSMAITVVRHKCGNRVTITPTLYEALGSPETVQFSIVTEEQVLLIGKELNMKNSYKISTTRKPTIYRESLTKQIAVGFHLDFSEKSSITFSDVEVDSPEDGTMIAVVKMKV